MKRVMTLVVASITSVAGYAWASDATFIDNAIRGNLAEIKLGELAQQKGGSTQVKDYGKMLMDDHKDANDSLNNLVSSKKVPTAPSKEQTDTYTRLSKLSGEAFDTEFARCMVDDHTKDIKLYQKEAQSGRDSRLQSFAKETLPKLQSHLEMAQQLHQIVQR